MDPGDPLLRRAQEALGAQLAATRHRLEAELREKRKALSDAGVRREAVGVELYGFQQQLARLQRGLAAGDVRGAAVSAERADADARAAELRRAGVSEASAAAADQQKADLAEAELEALAVTLHQVEAHNTRMQSDIAVTRRATYVAEEMAGRTEKAAARQDVFIDSLHARLRAAHTSRDLANARAAEQRAETRAARELLAATAAEAEGVHWERRARGAQWRDSLLALQRRDEALKLVEEALATAGEQQRSLAAETAAFGRDAAAAAARREAASAVLRRLEAEGAMETLGRLAASLAATESSLAEARADTRRLDDALAAAQKPAATAQQAIQAEEAAALGRLAHAAVASKGATRAAADAAKHRAAAREREAAAEQLQHALAQMQGEVAARRRSNELERKAREVDAINRRLARAAAEAAPGENVGPLEATAANLARDVAAMRADGRALQRRWAARQAELASAAGGEALARLASARAVLRKRAARLDQQLEHVGHEVRDLERRMARQRSELGRLNAAVADSACARDALAAEQAAAQGSAAGQLQDEEAEVARLTSAVEAAREERRAALADALEAEKEALLWERRVQLEREAAAALGTTGAGGAEAGELRREAGRLAARAAEAGRAQERLSCELARAVERREAIIARVGRAVKVTPERVAHVY
ncbi:hypothetical protein WJX81_003736 [Elliptochloris bilobata]|uniref:Flagellar associated protein n=1 Tax=Elliptochloris bilobata TaxID=381761 RepID=A0AAW1RD33_9CHLO